jgi:hypothetical protein
VAPSRLLPHHTTSSRGLRRARTGSVGDVVGEGTPRKRPWARAVKRRGTAKRIGAHGLTKALWCTWLDKSALVHMACCHMAGSRGTRHERRAHAACACKL